MSHQSFYPRFWCERACSLEKLRLQNLRSVSVNAQRKSRQKRAVHGLMSAAIHLVASRLLDGPRCLRMTQRAAAAFAAFVRCIFAFIGVIRGQMITAILAVKLVFRSDTGPRDLPGTRQTFAAPPAVASRLRTMGGIYPRTLVP